MKHNLLNEMKIFYHVAKKKSFSSAADELSVSKSFVSKRITFLEKSLNTRLITRTTRTLNLTEEGKNLYHYCSNIVQEEEQAYRTISELKGKAAGPLKISIPPALALNVLSPFFSKFLINYPEIKLDISLENNLIDLVRGGYDLALRSANLESSSLIAQKIYTFKNGIFGSKGYFEENKPPEKATELTQHYCAIYSESTFRQQLTLSQKENPKEKESAIIQGNFTSNQLDLIKQLVLHGNCLGILPEFMVSNELRSGALKPCLSNFTLPEGKLYAVYPEKDFMPLKLKLFLKMIKTYLSEQ